MKKIILLLVLICSVNIFSQETPAESSKWRFGGGLGLSFGSNDYFGFAISPFAGYEITPMLEAGVTAGYQYSKWSDSRQNLFNFGPYVNFYPIQNLFLRTHFEHYIGTNKIDYEFEGSYKYNFEESALWLGGGYRSSGKVQVFGGLMYNVLYKEDQSLFSTGLRPIFGVSVGL